MIPRIPLNDTLKNVKNDSLKYLMPIALPMLKSLDDKGGEFEQLKGYIALFIFSLLFFGMIGAGILKDKQPPKK